MARAIVTRRSLITSAAATAGAAALGGMPAWAQDAVRLRMFWWGSKERAERTDKAMVRLLPSKTMVFVAPRRTSRM